MAPSPWTKRRRFRDSPYKSSTKLTEAINPAPIMKVVIAVEGQAGSWSQKTIIPTNVIETMASPPVNRALVNKLVEDVAVGGDKIRKELEFRSEFALTQGWHKSLRER